MEKKIVNQLQEDINFYTANLSSLRSAASQANMQDIMSLQIH